MKTSNIISILLISLTFCISAHAEIFMLGRANVMGAPQSIVVLFSDKELTTHEACMEEKRLGQKGNWRHYYHFVTPYWKRYINPAYFCVDTKLRIAKWFDDTHYNDTYRFTIINNNSFTLIPYSSFADCNTALRKDKLIGRHDVFCARMNQKMWRPNEQKSISAAEIKEK